MKTTGIPHEMKNDTSKKIRKLTASAIFAAFLCIIAPWSIPVGAVPVSVATFAVYLTGLTLGRRGIMSVVCYILLGCVGLPVFSGFSGGAGVFAGPTGGFLAGYIPAVLVCGFLSDILSVKIGSRAGRFLGYLIAALSAAVIIHACGIFWYVRLTGVAFTEAAAVCVLPFILPECVKIVSAVLIAQVLRERLAKIR